MNVKQKLNALKGKARATIAQNSGRVAAAAATITATVGAASAAFNSSEGAALLSSAIGVATTEPLVQFIEVGLAAFGVVAFVKIVRRFV